MPIRKSLETYLMILVFKKKSGINPQSHTLDKLSLWVKKNAKDFSS